MAQSIRCGNFRAPYITRHSPDKLQVRGDKPFDDHDVKPAAIEPRMFLLHADLAKAMFAAQRATGLIERKNAGQQFPQAQSFRFTDESSDQ
jgi:hypothetical protein